jgi:Zn-dependent protease with chaperone function
MMKKMLLGLTAVATLGISGCATMADFAGVDSQQLNAQAGQSFNALVSQAGQKGQLDTTSATSKRINAVFNRLRPYANQMNQTGLPFQWQLAVLKSNDINAMVAPGGKVLFYTGIVDRLKLTDAEIAAIMGHEMVHALEEHAKQKIGAQALTNIALQVGLNQVGGGVSDSTAQLAQLGSQIGIGLPYSRSLETRADQGGLFLMARAGYNPQAAITLWEKMNRAEGSSPAFLSTHPSNSQRIAAMREHLPAALQIYNQNRK